MQPNKVSIPQLLADGTGFYVPFYQRAYVWKEKLWDRFIRDMEYISKTDEEYFIGSVILKKMGANGIETARWSVVDGQQRLTTLAIFYKVISLKNPNAHNPFDKRFRLDDDSLSIKHSLNDKEAFEKIANLESDVELPGADSSNLIKAYNYFRTHVDPEKIQILNIQARLWFVAIYLEADENEHKIFDTINSLGMSLNTEELLKNHLFTSATLDDFLAIWKPVFEADDACLNYWKTETSVGASGKKTLSDRFFHTLLQIIMHDSRNNISSDDRVSFRKYDDENEFNNFQKVIESGHWDKIEFAKEIASYASLFKKIYSKADIQKDPESFKTPLKRLLLIIFTLDVYTAMPYILFVLKNVQDVEEQNKIFTLLEAYIIRRQICNKVTKNYSDLFTEGLIGQRKLSYDSLCEYLSNKKPNESLHMPYDAEVEIGFSENSTLASDKARGILYLLESKLREMDGSQTVLHPFDKYSLEHLMPQKWEENWKAPDNLNEVQLFDFKNTRNKTICTLGNLAIITLGLNSSISNSKWKKKVDGGLRDKAGDLITMKDVVNKSKWDEGTISARAEWLADKANLIWENVISSGEVEEEEIVNGRDTTQYSLDNGVTFLSKSSFVRTFIKLYIEKHPSLTINELKDIFKDSYLKSFKRIGFICTEDEINTKVLKNGRKPTNEDLDRWYNINDPEAWRISGDGIRFIPNNQMTRQSAEIIKGIAENDGWNIVVKRNS